ncbi:hypothetical protein [Pseudomonas sp. 2FE]|uniref:hypothetical protein n=1 Tax=Pseudomonas sp. 2FE TaxID=2502190 RepID=UPI0010F4D8A0|nr:hypothetical protein [Pseudomonas sp. 2FE]
MLIKKKTLLAVAACTMMFASASLLPISAAHARSGNGGGHGGGTAGGHSGSHSSNGHGAGLSSDHSGKAVRAGDEHSNHYGRDRADDSEHGSITSGVANSKDTRGLSKATAISATTPGEHNTKGLSNAATSTSKNDR